MKNLIVFLFLIFISCKKEEPKKNIYFDKENKDILKPLDQPENVVSGKENQKIEFCFDNDGLKNDFIKITLEKLVYDKDSISTGSLKVDFSHNSEFLKSFRTQIQNYNNEYVWNFKRGFFDKIKDEDSKSSFFVLNTGFAACGYTQTNFLFNFDSKNFNLVHTWFSSFDGGFNYFQQFITDKKFDENKSFYSVMISVEPDDESDDKGTANYSDSVFYFKINNSWRTRYITKKDSVFRKKKINFKEFYKNE